MLHWKQRKIGVKCDKGMLKHEVQAREKDSIKKKKYKNDTEKLYKADSTS